MSACEVVLTKGNQARKTKKEPTLVLRSIPNGEIPRLTEGPPSYDKCVSAAALTTHNLQNGLSIKNRPNGTKTTVTALVHHDSSDNEEKETTVKDKVDTQPLKIIPNGHMSSVTTGENIPEHGEIELEIEAIDIHGDRTYHKDVDVNDNYLKQEKQTKDEIEISQTENDIRNYVIAEQAKGIQYKTASYKRPPYASLVYGASETEDDLSDDPKLNFLKVSDHEDSLSGIDMSETEMYKSYEADEELSLPGTLDGHKREPSPVLTENIVTEDKSWIKQDTWPYLETLADILLENEVPDDTDALKTKNGDDIVAFFADAPEDVRNMIAHYLKKRRLSYVLLTPSNLHYALHASDVLELKPLTSHCYEFLDENPQFDQKSLVMSCDSCQNVIRTRNQEKVTVMKATASKQSNPHFCIAFSRQEAQRTNIDVIDINTGSEIYTRDTKRPFLCDRGFSCYSVHFNDCPYVFVSGGKNKHSKQMWRYDVIVSEWKRMPSMIHGRSYHSMISFNDCAIYVIGGTEVDCIEEFCLDTKKWSECTRLNSPVESSACAVYEKKIYIFGGDDSVGSVQCFTPSANTMETLHPLPCPVVEGHAVVFRDKIFIVSGQGQMVYFEPVTGLSYLGAYQPVIRSKFCLFVKYDKIYITGGRLEEKSPEKESEYNYRYNMSTDAWTRTRKVPGRFPVRTFCDVHIQRRCPVVPFDKIKI